MILEVNPVLCDTLQSYKKPSKVKDQLCKIFLQNTLYVKAEIFKQKIERKNVPCFEIDLLTKLEEIECSDVDCSTFDQAQNCT